MGVSILRMQLKSLVAYLVSSSFDFEEVLSLCVSRQANENKQSVPEIIAYN